MPVDFGLWRIDGAPRRLTPTMMPTEKELEELIESDTSILGEELLVIGRQVATPHGTFVDLMAVDSEGGLVVLELKRDKTPRDVVGQVLDYASWATKLGDEGVRGVWDARAGDSTSLDEAFTERFHSVVPDDLGASVRLVVVAGSIDSATERIVTFLSDQFGVPVNVVFFQYFEDDGRRYLARSWLVEPQDERAVVAKSSRPTAPWNGRDWYVSFGDDGSKHGRSWEDARRFGFVSGGGGDWYSGTLKNLPLDGRVMVNIPSTGYVGVGRVVGEAQPASQSVLQVDGVATLFRELALTGDYHLDEPEENEEWVVPVEWEKTLPIAEAFWRKGMFGNQNTACRLRNQFTIEQVEQHFGLSS